MLVLEVESVLGLAKLLLELLRRQPKLTRVFAHVVISIHILLRPFGEHVQDLATWVLTSFELARFSQIFLDLFQLLTKLIIKRLNAIYSLLGLLEPFVDRLLEGSHTGFFFSQCLASLDPLHCHLVQHLLGDLLLCELFLTRLGLQLLEHFLLLSVFQCKLVQMLSMLVVNRFDSAIFYFGHWSGLLRHPNWVL